MTGTPPTTTPTLSDNSTKIPNTAWVQGQGFLTGGAGNGFAHGGDGSDGAVVLDGTNTYPTLLGTWGSAGSYGYYLKRDVFLTTLTINSGVTLVTANLRIFCSISATINGTLANCGSAGAAGGDASGATGGSAQTGNANTCCDATGAQRGACDSGTLGGNVVAAPQTSTSPNGVAGKNGGTGAGTTGNTGTSGQINGSNAFTLNVTYPTGAAGGGGGNVGGTTGGSGGGAGPGTSGALAAKDAPRVASQAIVLRGSYGYWWGTSQWIRCDGPNPGGGGGGGSGAGDGTNSGGGGGASGANGGCGGWLLLSSPTINVGASGVITADGGKGGNGGKGGSPAAGTAAGGGGGAGGSGGIRRRGDLDLPRARE